MALSHFKTIYNLYLKLKKLVKYAVLYLKIRNYKNNDNKNAFII
jgi:hypothetical protein